LEKLKERGTMLERELKKANGELIVSLKKLTLWIDIIAKSKTAQQVNSLMAENKNMQRLMDQSAKEHKEQVRAGVDCFFGLVAKRVPSMQQAAMRKNIKSIYDANAALMTEVEGLRARELEYKKKEEEFQKCEEEHKKKEEEHMRKAEEFAKRGEEHIRMEKELRDRETAFKDLESRYLAREREILQREGDVKQQERKLTKSLMDSLTGGTTSAREKSFLEDSDDEDSADGGVFSLKSESSVFSEPKSAAPEKSAEEEKSKVEDVIADSRPTESAEPVQDQPKPIGNGVAETVPEPVAEPVTQSQTESQVSTVCLKILSPRTHLS
jgi:hypothetical protein